MTREEIRAKLETIITRNINKTISLEQVTEESRLRQDLGIDSLETVELLFEIEMQFDVKISDDEAVKMVTVRDAVDTIQKKLSGE